MSQTIRIKRGKDIHLIGEAKTSISEYNAPDVVALKPTDVVGLNPKLLLKEGAPVKAGTPLFHEKTNDKIVFPSPISGVVSEIVRGAKRKILEIRVKNDGAATSEDFGMSDPTSMNREQVIDKMLKGGVWPLMRQRPFSIIANPTDVPKGIYISCFDSAPLAPDMDLVIQGQEEAFKAGVEVLRKISNDKVHLSIGTQGGTFFSGISGVTVNRFEGPHPASNIGVQVHHLDPINRGEKIWYTYPQEVVIIGRLFLSGRYDGKRKVALTGSMAKDRGYHTVMTGAPLAPIVNGRLEEGAKRIISGTVLTGTKVEEDGFLGYFDNQITVIPEGDQHKFLLTDGWLSPGLKRFSMSRAYPSWLMGKKKYDLDTNLNGEIRSFVVTGQLEKVFPFDIYPMQLIKAIMVNDIDNMEKMGVYEIDAEDFALCEVACTSKIDIQNVVREGMERLRAELS
jgi:Na+-transporting NADH:ubiquinone oxidoreductase subunit A